MRLNEGGSTNELEHKIKALKVLSLRILDTHLLRKLYQASDEIAADSRNLQLLAVQLRLEASKEFVVPVVILSR